MYDKIDTARRALLSKLAALGAIAPLTGVAITAGSPAAADERAEDGHAHDYVNDAADAADHRRYREGSLCSNCIFWQGGDEEWGGCQHPAFRNVEVNANGWCNAWARGS
jgi:hypothetical protein